VSKAGDILELVNNYLDSLDTDDETESSEEAVMDLDDRDMDKYIFFR
jgi:hypothetical protein